MPRVSCRLTVRKYKALDNKKSLDQKALKALYREKPTRKLEKEERRRLIGWFKREIVKTERRLRSMSPTVTRCRRQGFH